MPGKRQTEQRFDLKQDHIDLRKAGRNNADGIRVLMEDLERQFMSDPIFFVEDVPAATGADGKLNASLRGSPVRDVSEI